MPSPLVVSDVALAVAALRGGRLAAFPTETVYGLGADASRAESVARIYAAKGRPAYHPVIVHLADQKQLDDWASDVPGYARRLADRFWPGPLTLVLPRAKGVGDHVTGGSPTVGLRVPAHPVAQALLAAFGGGVAAPSANRFGRVSPTTAQHVVDELGDVLDAGHDVVLDGGPCEVGVESTIVDCTGPAPRLLRPGRVSADQVAAATGLDLAWPASDVRAPGTLPSHYAPNAHVAVVGDAATARLLRARLGADVHAGFLAPADVESPDQGWRRLGAPRDAQAYAHDLYAALREADAAGIELVVAVPPPEEGIGAAVRDRLRRAAHRGTALADDAD